MKLLYLHNTPLDSQKSNMIQVLYMCDAFARLGVQVSLAVPQSDRQWTVEGIRAEVEAKIGRPNEYPISTFAKLMLGGRLQSLGGYLSVKKVLKETEADCVFVRSPQFLHLSVAAGLPTIFESHNSLLHNRYKLLDDFWRDKLLRSARSPNLMSFISISQALTDFWVEKGVPEQKCLSLHDSIDEQVFRQNHDKKDARAELGLPQKQQIVLYAGSLYDDRGIENIVKLAANMPETRFIVLGGPEDRRIFFQTMSAEQKLENISYPGWLPRDQVKAYLAAADALLLIFTKKVPTINYCSPLKMFEYMAAGRTIVGHAFPTIKEVLVDGQTAFLAEPENFDSLLVKTRQALSDPRSHAIAQWARELALKEYTWLARAEKILKVTQAAFVQKKMAA